MEPLRQAVAGEKEVKSTDRVQWMAGQKMECEQALATIESLLNGLYRLLPQDMPNLMAAQMVLSLDNVDALDAASAGTGRLSTARWPYPPSPVPSPCDDSKAHSHPISKGASNSFKPSYLLRISRFLRRA